MEGGRGESRGCKWGSATLGSGGVQASERAREDERKRQRARTAAATGETACYIVLQNGAACNSAFQCVAVCCSLLQSVAVCCSVLQCVAGSAKTAHEQE